MAERPVEGLVVGALYPLRNGIASSTHLAGLDDLDLEEGDDRHSKQQRYHQVDGDGPGEVFQRIEEHALHCEEEGEEDGADTDGGEHHRHEVLLGGVDGRLFGLIAFVQVFQIAVDDHDRVVDNHSQHHNQRRKSDDVQFDACYKHDRHRYERAQRYGNGCDDGRSQGEEYHHHQDNDDHGDEKVAQEVGHTQAHHLRLVGYARHFHVGWQLVLTEVVEHLVYRLTILYHVIAWCHFHRKKDAWMPVLLDTACM